ncbi:hypothetical protein KJ853_04450 [Patescibacteria group bacterium]|nr:hypothetical protein [Patescibacteria group bacterium]
MRQPLTPTEAFRKLKLFEKMVKSKERNSHSDADIKDIFYKLLLLFMSCDDETVEAIIVYERNLFCKYRPAVFRMISAELIFYEGTEKDMVNA